MARLTVQGLQKYYGKVNALRGIDLDIQEGEFCVFVGPSGCGKSTLLRTIAGLEDIDGGSIAFDGEPMAGVPPRARNIAMVFQNYALYPYLNVFENIAFGLRARKFAQDEIRRLDHILERVALFASQFVEVGPRLVSQHHRLDIERVDELAMITRRLMALHRSIWCHTDLHQETALSRRERPDPGGGEKLVDRCG